MFSSRAARTAPAIVSAGAWSPPIASSTIFIIAPLCLIGTQSRQLLLDNTLFQLRKEWLWLPQSLATRQLARRPPSLSLVVPGLDDTRRAFRAGCFLDVGLGSDDAVVAEHCVQ